MICLKMRRWSLYDNVGGKGGRVVVAGGNGAGATNFWKGATQDISAWIALSFQDHVQEDMTWGRGGTHHQPHRLGYQVQPRHVIEDQTIAKPSSS